MKTDIHNLKKRLERTLELLDKSNVSKTNKSTILEFHNTCFAEALSVGRIARYIQILKDFSLLLKKDFKKATKKDIINLIQTIEKRDYAEGTKHIYKVCLKKFYRWLADSEEYPDNVRWIKTTVKNGRHKLPEEILTMEDIKELVKTAEHIRDKALIITLYESGCRIGETASLRLKNVQFDDLGAQLIVDGKTGMRRIRVINATPLLSNWISNHPMKGDPNSPLWVNIGTFHNKDAMNYKAIYPMIKRCGKKAGITKKVNPHAFRHARATHLANHLTEAQMKMFFGWTQSSDMAGVYVHLSGRDVDSALLETYGIKSKEEKNNKNGNDVLKIKICARCSSKNDSTGKFCNKCGAVLDIETAIRADEDRKTTDEILDKLMEDSKIKAIIAQRAKALGLLDKIRGVGQNE